MILHEIRLSRPADDTDLSDLCASSRAGTAAWFECEEHGAADCLDVPLCPDPTEAEVAAIRRRLVTTGPADEERLYGLLELRETSLSTFERMWVDTELARYGE